MAVVPRSRRPRARLATVAAALILVAALLALAPAGAHAAGSLTIDGAPAPGPDRYDRVEVKRTGSSSAPTVLVLVPGFYGGAGDFRLLARDLVRRIDGLQVWALDRRSNALEDTSAFDHAGPKTAAQYYLEGKAYRGRTFKPAGADDHGYVRRWGLRVALGDLRRVVKRARAGGRQVILGGHSLGATTTEAYAAWDFDGRAGYRSIDSMVLIDGGASLDAPPSRRQVGDQLSRLASASPFADPLGYGVPWAAGVFVQAGARLARERPDERFFLGDNPLVQQLLKPPGLLTNEAGFGYAADADETPSLLPIFKAHVGKLAADGDPRGWRDGQLGGVQRMTSDFVGRFNGTEWYYPSRLSLDIGAARALRPGRAGPMLDLRLTHRKQVDRPVYAFQTALTDGAVLRDARRLIDGSRIPRSRSVLDGDAGQAHFDPLVAEPSRNAMLDSLVPFLRARIAAGGSDPVACTAAGSGC